MSAMSSPYSKIWPLVGNSNPAISRRRVVLPQPDGPRSVKNSFSRMSTETLSSAANWASPDPKSLLTPRTSIAVLPGDSGTHTPHFRCAQLMSSGRTPSQLTAYAIGLGNRHLPKLRGQGCAFRMTQAPTPGGVRPGRSRGRRRSWSTALRWWRSVRRHGLDVPRQDHEIGQEPRLQLALAALHEAGIGAFDACRRRSPRPASGAGRAARCP